MKRILLIVLSLILLTVPAFAAVNDNVKPITLDGETLSAVAFLPDDTLYLPVRAVAEGLGWTVSWSNQGDIITVTLAKSSDTIILNLTTQQINNNGRLYAMYGNFSGDAAIVHNDSVYMDSALLAEAIHFRVENNQNSAAVSLSAIPQNPIRISSLAVSSDSDDMSVTMYVPQLSGLTDQTVQDSINGTLRAEAEKAYGEVLKEASDLISVKETVSDYINKAQAYFDYKVTYNQNDLLCIVLSDYQYAGGAHGQNIQTAYTFDLSTGSILSLGDLMNADSGYTTFFDTQIKTMIKDRAASGQLDELSPFNTLGDDPEFYLSNDAIVFYFQQYEYFPYAAGIQTFSFLYTGLNDYLNGAYGFLYAQPVTLAADKENQLAVGETGTVALAGNPTTGYSWHYTIVDPDLLTLVSENYTQDANTTDIVGSGGTNTWNFKALKTGITTVTFQYYRDWEVPSSDTQTVVYIIAIQ